MYEYLNLNLVMTILQINIHIYIYIYICFFISILYNTRFLYTILYVRSLPSYIYGLYRPIFTVFTVIICIYGLYGAISKVSTFPCPLKKKVFNDKNESD